MATLEDWQDESSIFQPLRFFPLAGGGESGANGFEEEAAEEKVADGGAGDGEFASGGGAEEEVVLADGEEFGGERVAVGEVEDGCGGGGLGVGVCGRGGLGKADFPEGGGLDLEGGLWSEGGVTVKWPSALKAVTSPTRKSPPWRMISLAGAAARAAARRKAAGKAGFMAGGGDFVFYIDY